MWRWYSRQGTTCAENRDACGIFHSAAYTFSVVVDASPRGERGIQFNTCWITAVLDRMSPELPSVASVLAVLHEGQKHLRTERFFAEKASYAAFLLPREAKDAYAFCCGDCTLGARFPDGNIEWLTRTHTLVTALEEQGINADASKRHIVTRTLNAKRFQKPEVHVVPAIAFGSWILATDGYRPDFVILLQPTSPLRHDGAIDEAIALADRIVVFTARPGRIKAALDLTMEYPRSMESPEMVALRAKLWSEIREESLRAMR